MKQRKIYPCWSASLMTTVLGIAFDGKHRMYVGDRGLAKGTGPQTHGTKSAGFVGLITPLAGAWVAAFQFG
jgi:hypothetical protein